MTEPLIVAVPSKGRLQEQTLAFIPKILVVFLVLLLTLPFMADALAAFMVEVSERIVAG